MNDVLRRIRESRGLKQIDVARRTGLSKQMISKMESPEGNPTLITLLKYLECINVDLAKALEKQIPKKPIIWENKSYDSPVPNDDWGYECPCCGNHDIDYPEHHCVCGQAIDWSEEE